MVVPPRPGLFEVGVIQEVFGVDRTDDGVPAIDFRACTEDPGRTVELDNAMSMTFPARAGRRRGRRPGHRAGVRRRRRRGSLGGRPRRLPARPRPRRLGALGLLGRLPARPRRPARRPRLHHPLAAHRRAAGAVPRGPHRPRRALRRGRPGDHQRRYRRRHRRLPAPRALRARRRRGQQDRPPDGGAAAARRRPAPVHRPPGPDLRRRQPGAAADLDARAPRRGAADPRPRRRAAMSERTFARRFVAETGTTPGKWLLAQRLHHARELLESQPTCRWRRSPPAPASARQRCCATTSGSTSASHRRSTAVPSGPRTCAPAEPPVRWRCQAGDSSRG